MYIVTGASSGIGRATAHALAQRGQAVLAVARSLAALKQLQRESPDRITPLQADLSTVAGLQAVMDALKGHEKISGIVHAAASSVPPKRYAQLQPAELLADMANTLAHP